MFRLFKKQNPMLLIVKVDYMSSEKGYRDFESKIFYVQGASKEDCYKKLNKHLDKVNADNRKGADEQIISEGNPPGNKLFIP